MPVLSRISPNPPMDTDGRREDTGRGVRKLQKRWSGLDSGRREVGGGLQALLGAPMAAYSGCGEGDGGIGHGKRRSRTGLARVGGAFSCRGRWVSGGRAPPGWEWNRSQPCWRTSGPDRPTAQTAWKTGHCCAGRAAWRNPAAGRWPPYSWQIAGPGVSAVEIIR